MKKENKFVKVIRILLLTLLSPVVLIFLVTNKIKLAKKRKIDAEKVKICTISQINSLSGAEFEEFLKNLFEKMGYSVQLTSKSKDYGADLVVFKNKKKFIVQAKCYNHTVGVRAVQEVISARRHYGIYDAMVISNNEFSREAQVLASENNVTLAGGSVLEKLIMQFDVRIDRQNSKIRSLTDAEKSCIGALYRFWI